MAPDVRDCLGIIAGAEDRSRRYEASAAFAAIVAWAHQTSSSKADFVAAEVATGTCQGFTNR
jgi:hypothetical protein